MQEVHDGPAVVADAPQRQAEQHREQEHLQDVAFGERADEGLGDDVQQGVDDRHALRGVRVAGDGLGVERSRRGMETGARREDVRDDESDQQRERGDDLEVDDGLEADLAGFLEVAHAGDPDHHGGEDDRPDDHLDQAHEGVTERFELRAEPGPDVPDGPADEDADQDLDIKMTQITHGGDGKMQDE